MNKEEIFKKLRIDGNKKMLIANAPSEYLEIFSGTELDTKPSGEGIYDFVQVFGYQHNKMN